MLDKVAHPGKKNHTIRTLTERDGNPGVPGISWDSYDYILDGWQTFVFAQIYGDEVAGLSWQAFVKVVQKVLIWTSYSYVEIHEKHSESSKT